MWQREHGLHFCMSASDYLHCDAQKASITQMGNNPGCDEVTSFWTPGTFMHLKYLCSLSSIAIDTQKQRKWLLSRCFFLFFFGLFFYKYS